MKSITQLSFNSVTVGRKFVSTLVLGLLISLVFTVFVSGSNAAAPLRIQGEVTKASTLVDSNSPTSAVFIIARKQEAKMPLAVLRIPNPKFPLKFDMGPEHVMTPGLKLEGEVFVEAKLTHRGDAISKAGDWIMSLPAQKVGLKPGAKRKLTLKLDEIKK